MSKQELSVLSTIDPTKGDVPDQLVQFFHNLFGDIGLYLPKVEEHAVRTAYRWCLPSLPSLDIASCTVPGWLPTRYTEDYDAHREGKCLFDVQVLDACWEGYARRETVFIGQESYSRVISVCYERTFIFLEDGTMRFHAHDRMFSKDASRYPNWESGVRDLLEILARSLARIQQEAAAAEAAMQPYRVTPPHNL